MFHRSLTILSLLLFVGAYVGFPTMQHLCHDTAEVCQCVAEGNEAGNGSRSDENNQSKTDTDDCCQPVVRNTAGDCCSDIVVVQTHQLDSEAAKRVVWSVKLKQKAQKDLENDQNSKFQGFEVQYPKWSASCLPIRSITYSPPVHGKLATLGSYRI